MHKNDPMTRLYYYNMGLSTLHLLQQKQMNDLIMSIHAPEIPAPPPAFGVPAPDCWFTCPPNAENDKPEKEYGDLYKEAFMDGYMAAVDYFIEHELDKIEPKEE